MNSLFQVLEQAVSAHPHRGISFVRHGDQVVERMDYGELGREARRLAVALKAEGVTPGSRVLLAFDSGLGFIRAFWGCIYSGAIPVPAPPPHPARLRRTLPHLERIAEDCEPILALTDSRYPLSFAGCPLLSPNLLQGDAGLWRPPPGSSCDALLQYTSGSTRHPRGVRISHDNLFANLAMLRQFHGEHDHPVMVHWLPLFHDMGLIRGMLAPIDQKGDLYLLDPMEFVERPARWMAALSRFKATLTGAPNFGYELAVRKARDQELQEIDLSPLRLAFCSAEPIRRTTVERFLSRFAPLGLSPSAFKPSYGLAEATVAVCGESGSSYRFRSLGSRALREGEVAAPRGPGDLKEQVMCGGPLGDLQVRVVDQENRVLGADAVGEVWLKGPSVALGYWRETDSIEFQRYTSEGDGPYLATGDLGFLDHEGSLCITGRKRDLLIIRGQNYYPQDLEEAVEEVEGVRPGCTAVFEFEGRVGVVCEAATGDFEEMKRLVIQVVGEEFGLGLARLVVLEPGAIPKTASGKVRRSLIRELCMRNRMRGIFSWNRPDGSHSSAPSKVP